MIALGKQHFQQLASPFIDLVTMIFDDHASAYRQRAGAEETTVHLDQTHPATAMHLKFRVVAQVRNIDTGPLRRLHNSLPRLESNGLIIQQEFRHRWSPPVRVRGSSLDIR